MNISRFAKLNKSTLRSIIGPMADFTNPYTKIPIFKESNCSACPTYKKIKEIEYNMMYNLDNLSEYEKEHRFQSFQTELDNLKDSCISSACCNISIKTIYNNDNKQYNLYHKKYAYKRLPKNATKLYLLLHFLPMITLGTKKEPVPIINNLGLSFLAKRLNCTTKTVLSSIELLQAFHYIDYSHCNDKYTFNIHIREYQDMHKSAKEGGSGYITLSNTILESIIETANVNCVRATVYKLLISDNYTKDKNNQLISIPISDIKRVLPTHVNYVSKLNKIFAGDHIFKTEFVNNICNFVLLPAHHLQRDIKVFKKNNVKLLKNYFKSSSLLRFIDIQDIGNMSVQYDIKDIIDVIKYIKDNYFDKNNAVKNVGGLIRSIIHKRYIQELAY